MTIAIGSDHRGYAVATALLDHLRERGMDVSDMRGSYNEDDDYPDSAGAVGEWVSELPHERRGIVVCGSGVGASIVANKYRGVRAGLCSSVEQVQSARHDDDINVLALAADYLSDSDSIAIADAFLDTAFAPEERYVRRINKIAQIEKNH